VSDFRDSDQDGVHVPIDAVRQARSLLE